MSTDMDEKAQFQKILEWLKQINRSVGNLQDGQDKLSNQVSFFEKKMNLRIDGLDERVDALSDAIQAMLKAVRGVRVDQFNDRSRFAKEIQKIRQEIRELTH